MCTYGGCSQRMCPASHTALVLRMHHTMVSDAWTMRVHRHSKTVVFAIAWIDDEERSASAEELYTRNKMRCKMCCRMCCRMRLSRLCAHGLHRSSSTGVTQNAEKPARDTVKYISSNCCAASVKCAIYPAQCQNTINNAPKSHSYRYSFPIRPV